MSAFTVDLKDLRKRDKPTSDMALAKADAAGDRSGFVDRSIKAPRGRPKSPRTGQVHAKVLPGVDTEIAEEAARRGVTQGVVIEEAWALYKADRR